MKHYKYAQNDLAAGAVLLLAVIFITACTNNQPLMLTEIAAATIPINTPTPIPPTATPSPTLTPPPTLRPSTATPTTTLSPTPTSVPATATPTQQPTLSSTFSTEISASSGVEVYETKLTIPTYPIKAYLTEQIDPVYNMSVFYFDRPNYETVAPPPTPVDYTGVVLENPYLRLTFIPELGGRLYSAVVKSTNQEVFYHNPAVKPSRYGVLEPYAANWWLAMGGMEWAYPTQEHGYRFGTAWNYSLASNRTGLTVKVTLPTNSAIFTVSPKLVNNGPDDVPVQLWINAALTLAPGSMSSQTQFVVPARTITIHSRGEFGWTVPGERLEAPWPLVGQTDLRDYRQWANYLGFFVSNQAAPFIGAYNPAANLGIIRLVAPGTASGSGKLFAFGRDFPDRSYTDDDSQYFEIWGGANASFWPEDDIVVPAGQTLSWEESWWPVARLGGITQATGRVAIYLSQIGDSYTLSALMSQPTQGKLQVSARGVPLFSKTFSADPATLLHWNFSAANEPINIQFLDNNETKLLAY
jgi:hypothetical protein